MSLHRLAATVGCALLPAALLIAACAGAPPEPRGPTPATGQQADPTPVPDAPAGWRAESYRGLEVRVPADWGWGAAPSADPSDSAGRPGLWCPADKVVAPPGVEDRVGGRGYVGRPATLSDMCVVYDPDRPLPPDGPFVWLGAELPPGSHRVGAYTVETRRLGGTTVTVASTDDALRAEILGSARRVDTDANGCPVRPFPPGGISVEGIGKVQSMSVCLYQPDRSGRSLLFGSARLGAAAGRLLVDAVYDGSRSRPGPVRCGYDVWQRGTVGLVVHNEDAFGAPGSVLHTRFVVDLTCPRLVEPRGGAEPLTVAMVRPWLHPLTRTYISADGMPSAVASYFRPLLP